MFPFPDAATFLTVSTAIILVGMSRISFGGGAGVIAVPLLTFVLPPSKAVGVLLPVMIICDFIMLRFYFKGARWHLIKLLAPGTLLGILIGTMTFALASEDFQRKLLGFICIVFFLLRILRGRILEAEKDLKPNGGNAFLFGAGAGYTSTILHAGGPALTMFLLPLKIPPHAFVATCVCYFTIVNLIKVPTYLSQRLITPETLIYGLWILPAMIVGSLVGIWINSRVPEKAFMNTVYAFLLVIGFYFLIK